jgi:nucleotide-binding universal stress UspA family protein
MDAFASVGDDRSMKSIVVAVDGSDVGDLAVGEAIELAKDAGATITVVTVRQPISFLGAPYDQRELSRQLAHARAALDRAKGEIEGSGVEATYEIREGEPAEEILALAEDRRADLVVIGSRGLGTIAGALLGSVSKAVVRGADRPVLVVKERAHAHLGARADAPDA